MSNPADSSRDWQFEELMRRAESGEADDLFAHLLHPGMALFDPLANFLIRQPNEPRVAILVDLLGKLGDPRAVPILMRFLDIPVAELRLSAATALGWLRATAALEKLDRLEAHDSDERVRTEARTAIDEILIEHPSMSHVLRHHKPSKPTETDADEEAAALAVREEERERLMAAIPQLLALKYRCVPLGFTDDGTIRVAVRSGSENRLATALRSVTGRAVHVRGWTDERIENAIEHLYVIGDDDFALLGDAVSSRAVQEVVEILLSSIDPTEPACPLDEACDGAEAAQAFLAFCEGTGVAKAMIDSDDADQLTIRIEGERGAQVIEPPVAELRDRFLATLQLMGGLSLSEGSADVGGRFTVGAGSTQREISMSRTITETGVLRLELNFHPAAG